jgi:hypothetical protein
MKRVKAGRIIKMSSLITEQYRCNFINIPCVRPKEGISRYSDNESRYTHMLLFLARSLPTSICRTGCETLRAFRPILLASHFPDSH